MKVKALAVFLNVTEEEIDSSEYDENLFEFENQEYLVLTDEEANERTKEYISDTVWAFNTDFIIQHSSTLDYDKASEQVIRAIQDLYENGNEAIKKLIDDFDEFVENAISADGRGHFISGYDGEENEEGGFYIYRIN